MAHIFNYSILTAIPDARRGERVNVGIVVFLAERLDIRFSDIAKLRALTGMIGIGISSNHETGWKACSPQI